ncbi:MAG: AraC family transcriptional regulator [Thermodesulfobacteriota bacterium]
MPHPPSNSIRLWRPAGVAGVELVRARYRRQSFARHVHEDYGLGVVEQGALGFRYRGENLVADPGAISLVIPGEAHDGHPADSSGWAYRMFYVDAAVMGRMAEELAGKRSGLPYLSEGVLHDPALARTILCTHQALESPETGRLEAESRLMAMMSGLLLRHAKPLPRPRRMGREHGAVRRAKEFIRERFASDIALEDLAGAAGLSKFHLIRVFAKETGLSPHSFLMQVRAARAKESIAAGLSPADAAIACGFFDQSHLTRHFRRFYGITPGFYRNSVL